jgi:rhodanese-related sulfurtransferase
MRSVLSAVLALLVVSFALPVAAGDHTADSLATVKAKVKQKSAVLLDVREKEEWDDGHLRDAKPLPLSRLRQGLKKETLTDLIPKQAIVYLHCASGQRCLAAAEVLKKMGYDARPLKEGYQALVKAGFPKATK